MLWEHINRALGFKEVFRGEVMIKMRPKEKQEVAQQREGSEGIADRGGSTNMTTVVTYCSGGPGAWETIGTRQLRPHLKGQQTVNTQESGEEGINVYSNF